MGRLKNQSFRLIVANVFLAAFCLPTPPAVLASDEVDHDQARRLLESGQILSLHQLMESLPQTRNGKVLEVELEQEKGRYTYEVEILDPQGQVWEYRIDAKTGKLLTRERGD